MSDNSDPRDSRCTYHGYYFRLEGFVGFMSGVAIAAPMTSFAGERKDRGFLARLSRIGHFDWEVLVSAHESFFKFPSHHISRALLVRAKINDRTTLSG